MSAHTMSEVWASVEAAHREVVMQETWGHFAPQKNITYRGRIVYAIGCYDSGELNPTPLVVELAGLDDSPWLYSAIHEFLQSIEGNVAGCVYEWSGSFRNYKFSKGAFRLLVDASSADGAK